MDPSGLRGARLNPLDALEPTDVDLPEGLSELLSHFVPPMPSGYQPSPVVPPSRRSTFASSRRGPRASTASVLEREQPEAPADDDDDLPSQRRGSSLTLEHLLGMPPRLPPSPPTEGAEQRARHILSVPDTARRSSAFRSGPLGMSFPNGRIDDSARGRANREAGRREGDHEREVYPWTNAMATASRAGYRSTGSSADSRYLDFIQHHNSVAQSAMTRRILNPQPQQASPPGNHMSWASLVPRSSNERIASTTLRRRSTTERASTEERSDERQRPQDRSSALGGSRRTFALPLEIAQSPPLDDDIRETVGASANEDDAAEAEGEGEHETEDMSRWGQYHFVSPLVAASLALRSNGGPLFSQDLAELDAWGEPPGAGASLTRGRYNRRRGSMRSRLNAPRLDDDDDEALIDFTPRSRVRSWTPTNLGESSSPVIVGSQRGVRRRRRSSAGEDVAGKAPQNAHPLPPAIKRQKRQPAIPAARPSYVDYSALPSVPRMPGDLAVPGPRSFLERSTIESEGLPPRRVIKFSSHNRRISNKDEDARALRSDRPIPHFIGVHYYEVEILSRGQMGYISVGWMRRDVNLERLVGWDQGAWGWHGDDGKSFEGSGDGVDFSEPWDDGDTVGCGIDFTTRKAFFTRNGKLVGTTFKNMPHSLHPAVGLRAPGESVAVNFAGPFKFDIEAHVAKIRDGVRAHPLLKRKQGAFSDLPLKTKVPRLVGVPLHTDENEKLKGKGKAKAVADDEPPAYLPADSALRDSGSRATAALVLDHLEHAGHAEVFALLKASMAKRGWLAPSDSKLPAAPADVADDKVTADNYPSPSAAVLALATILKSQGRIPWALLTSLDPKSAATTGPNAALGHRLKVHDFASLCLASLGDDDDDMDDTTVSLGRDLRRLARDDAWGPAEMALLDDAGALLAGPNDAVQARLAHARQTDAIALERAMRDHLGLKHRSFLELAIAQTGLVRESLDARGDGAVAFVGLHTILPRAPVPVDEDAEGMDMDEAVDDDDAEEDVVAAEAAHERPFSGAEVPLLEDLIQLDTPAEPAPVSDAEDDDEEEAEGTESPDVVELHAVPAYPAMDLYEV